MEGDDVTNARRSFGSVRRLASGRFQVRYRDRSGASHTGAQTFPTRPQAVKCLATIQTDLERDTWFDPRRAKAPFEDLVEAWRGSRPNLRLTTQQAYASSLRSLLLPFFGGVPADQITSEAVRSWYSWAASRPRNTRGRSQPLSRNTVAKAYRLLKAIMDTAVDDGVIARNPCRLRGVASDQTPEQQVATAEQVHRICEAVDPRYRAMVLLAAYGGLRFGELVGLRRHRIDFGAGTVRVVEQVAQPDASTFVTGPPKTDAGVRTVTLPAQVMNALRNQVEDYAVPGKTGLMFPSPSGTFLRRSNFTRRVWKPALATAGIEHLRFHDLRHTHATLAVAMGIDTRTLMARMGHASSRAALIYQHAQSDQAVADGFDAVIARAAATAGHAGTDGPLATDRSGTQVARRGLRAVE
jgi:integrase